MLSPLLRRAFLCAALVVSGMLFPSRAAHAQQPDPIPQKFKTIYPSPSEAHHQLDRATKLAGEQHKPILLEFGNDQSPDCQVLAKFLAAEPVSRQIAEHFLLVRINVGKGLDQNRDLAERFHVPLANGVPALAVVDASGKLLNDPGKGEFLHASNMSKEDVASYLSRFRQ